MKQFVTYLAAMLVTAYLLGGVSSQDIKRSDSHGYKNAKKWKIGTAVTDRGTFTVYSPEKIQYVESTYKLLEFTDKDYTLEILSN